MMAIAPRSAGTLVSQLCLLFLLFSVSLVTASPIDLAAASRHEAAPVALAPKDDDLAKRQNKQRPLLRIMPLGASITAGVGTSPQNGYRKPLRDQLRWRGWPVNMVGSQQSGNVDAFKDRQHEGHPGHVVGEMIAYSDMSMARKPNVILINAGTNDAIPSKGQNVARTAKRMEAVLNHLFDNIDGVTIVLSTLIPHLQSKVNNNVNQINAGYRDLARRLASSGRKIVLAEMNNGFLDTGTDYDDNVHPNKRGAAKLAAVWDQAILEAERKRFLTAPADAGALNTGPGLDDYPAPVDPKLPVPPAVSTVFGSGDGGKGEGVDGVDDSDELITEDDFD